MRTLVALRPLRWRVAAQTGWASQPYAWYWASQPYAWFGQWDTRLRKLRSWAVEHRET